MDRSAGLRCGRLRSAAPAAGSDWRCRDLPKAAGRGDCFSAAANRLRDRLPKRGNECGWLAWALLRAGLLVPGVPDQIASLVPRAATATVQCRASELTDLPAKTCECSKKGRTGCRAGSAG